MVNVILKTICLSLFLFMSQAASSNDINEKLKNQRCHFSKCFVSIYHLISNPMLYHNKTIVVIGVLATNDKTNSAIYFDIGSKNHMIDMNGVYIKFDGTFEERFKIVDSKYGLLEGVFDAKDLGPTNQFLGTIVNVKRLLPWPPG